MVIAAWGVQAVRRSVVTSAPADDDLSAFLSGFHSIALAAYMLVAAETGQWPPDSELTRRRAYVLYEADLRRKSARAQP